MRLQKLPAGSGPSRPPVAPLLTASVGRLVALLAVVAIAGCQAGGGPVQDPGSLAGSQPRSQPASQVADADPIAALPNLPRLDFERYRLDNGLEVILHQDRRLPLVAVSVWYHVGAINEREGRSGFAHLFEHMMFQGSPHVGEDQHFKILRQVGATGANGTTDFDRTNYFETMPSHELETALWLESDRMGFLLSSLSVASLKNQIDVVQGERRQSVENRPYGLMNERIVQTLYPKPHPYYGDVIGSMDDIAAATVADVQDFFRTYYTPANATLTLAGDFDPATAKALIAKYFGTLRGRPAPERPSIPAPPLEGEVRVDFAEPIGKLDRLVMVWTGPSVYDSDSAALDVLAHVISGTRSARLDRKVTFDDRIAQSVTAYYSEYTSGGLFRIDVTLVPGRDVKEAEAAVNAVLDDLRKNPPTAEEVFRAQNTTETNLIRGLEQVGGFGGRAELLQRYNHYLGDPGRLGWDIARYRRVTPDDVSRVLDKYLGEARLVLMARPEEAQK